MNPLCIYHGNCADGFGAAWVVRRYFAGMVDFHAGVYGNTPPDCSRRDVIMVDFSYKRAVIDEIANAASTVLILDHHKTAAEDLAPFPSWHGPYNPSAMLDYQRENNAPISVHAIFDMERSGAGLTWDFFFSTEQRPKLIDHIEDRDLWRFKLPFTREIQAAVFSEAYDFGKWDFLMTAPVEHLIAEGVAIERKHHKDVAELVGVCKRRMKIGGQIVWGASLPYTLTSDAGNMMAADGEPFAACYWDTPEGRVFSLRSREGGADVSEIAKAYGGGGHKNASGFRVPLNQIQQFEVTS